MLAGWEDPSAPISAPSLDAIINSGNAEKIEAFCHELFQETAIHQLLSTKLKGFRNMLVALILVYYKPVKRALGLPGNQPSIILAMQRAALQSEILVSDLPIYSDLIVKQYKVANVHMSENKDEAIKTLQSTCLDLLDMNKETLSEVKEGKAEQKEMKGMIEHLIGVVETLQITTSPAPSSGSKRPRTSSASSSTPLAQPQQLITALDASAPSDRTSTTTAPTVSTLNSASVQPRNLNSALISSQNLSETINWDGLGTWNAHQLLTHCQKYKQDHTKDVFIPRVMFTSTATSPVGSLRKQAKTVLALLKTEATKQNAANSKFFHPKEVPENPCIF